MGEAAADRLGAWLTTVARRYGIDVLRRRTRGRELEAEQALLDGDPQEEHMDAMDTVDTVEVEEAVPVEDDLLRLVFTCCHPALSTEAQVGREAERRGPPARTGVPAPRRTGAVPAAGSHQCRPHRCDAVRRHLAASAAALG